MSPDTGGAYFGTPVSVLEGSDLQGGLRVGAGKRVHLDLKDEDLASDLSGQLEAERMVPLWPAGEYDVCPGDLLVRCLETPETGASRLPASSEGLRLIVLTHDESDESLIGALALGAWAMLELRFARQDLADALCQVSAGQAPILGLAMKRERVAAKLLGAARTLETPIASAAGTNPVNPLNAKELDMLRLAAEGVTNRQIASRLQLSEQTVKNYMSAIFDKLGVRRRAHATSHAQRNGWL
ncbi:MAG: response regulator transcription factor [Chloroflexota bacterium]